MNATELLEAFAYYINNGGYYEKASAKNLSRRVEDFQANRGSGNYTYMGALCGCNPGAWCAMMVSTAVYEACGSDRAAAKTALWGRWPHYNCGTIADDAMALGLFHWSWYGLNKKGKSGEAYTPKAGDVIVFTDAWKTRDHTGVVYAADGSYVYTYEGNSGNMARKRKYPLVSAYIYGYATPVMEAGGTEEISPIARFQRHLGVAADGDYGPVTKKAAIRAHQRAVNEAYGLAIAEDGVWGPETYYATRALRAGDEGADVTLWQGILYCLGQDPVGMDGDFGANTEKATAALQEALGLSPSGVADPCTWAKAFGKSRPAHTLLRRGSTGPEVRYLQELLGKIGYTLQTDGVFGPLTEQAVRLYQAEEGIETDGVVGPETWGRLANVSDTSL